MNKVTQHIGLLGGTFDPIHDGHIAIANHVLSALALDRIEFIPCYQSPHRDKPIASPQDRLAMTKLAIDNSHFTVNPCEIERQHISYTLDTITALKQKRPHDTFYWIMGSDVFSQFHTWESFEKILTLTHLVVLNRANQKIETPALVLDYIQKNKLESQVHCLTMKPLSISATRIRKEISEGKKNIAGLNPVVREYIAEHGVYRR